MKNNLMVIDGTGLMSILVYGSLSDFNKAAKLDADQVNSIVSQCFRHGNNHITENVGQAIVKILSLSSQFECKNCVVLFDKSSSTTFRKQMYPNYKAQRIRIAGDVIKDQVIVTKCILNKIGIPAFWSDKYEADDLAGSIINRFKDEYDTVYFYSKDRDWFQLLDKNVKGLVPYNTETEAAALREYYNYEPVNNPLDLSCPTAKGKVLCVNEDVGYDILGVYPECVPDYKGFAGDSSDNIPGVSGVGDKTAAALLAIFGDMDGVYNALSSMTEDQFKTKIKYLIKKCPYNALINGKNDAYLCKDLATIRTQINVPFDTSKLRININKTNLIAASNIYNLENDLDYYCR